MVSLLIFLCIAALFNTVTAGKHDIYTGYSVHGVQLRDRADQKVLYDLQLELDVDVWDHGAPEVNDALVMVTPDNVAEFLDRLDKNGMNHYLHISDVATAFERYDRELSSWKQSRTNRMIFENYPTYEEVDAYLERIAAEYPNIVTLVNAGPSFEGRPVKYLKISSSNFTDTNKPIYFLDATMHAREWVTLPVALYTVHRLVENPRRQDRDLLENIDWIVMPIVNPDGYVYSHTTDRLWRRTRSYNASISTECWGVDANRNFDVNFNTLGVSSDVCSNTFPGQAPFSEPETRHVRDVLLENIDRIQLYLNVHSSGNYVLFGYGDATLPPNGVQLHHVAATMGAAIDAMKLPQARYYIVGNSNMALYGSSGSAQDYGQFVGVPFSYTLELPGYTYGHLVPPRYVGQITAETWAGVAASARLASHYYRAGNGN